MYESLRFFLVALVNRFFHAMNDLASIFMLGGVSFETYSLCGGMMPRIANQVRNAFFLLSM
jgi:hypothetical protein